MAGPNGSIQGPAEAKWGYTTLNVADWDGDGLPDIVLNSIWGEVSVAARTSARARRRSSPRRSRSKSSGTAPQPKLAWGWWKPQGKELRHAVAHHAGRVRLQPATACSIW